MCASTAYVKNNLANYLPLTGGTITGQLHFNGAVISSAYDDKYKETWFAAGGGWGQGGILTLFPKDNPYNPGHFSLIATDGGNNIVSLTGKPDGTLLWNSSEVFLPVGAVFAFAANSVPYGCLLCNGGAVSRTTYTKLFSVIGTTYGEGDGSTTFNLPNLTDRFIQGSGTAGAVKDAGLPNILGSLGWIIASGSYTNISTSALYFANQSASSTRTTSGNAPADISFNATRSNSIYGASDTVQPPALTMRYYIKY